MVATRSRSVRVCFLVALLGGGLVSGCQRGDPPSGPAAGPLSPAAAPQAAPAAKGAAQGGAGPGAPPDGGASPDGAAASDDGGAGAGTLVGSWLEGNIYKLKVESMRWCGAGKRVPEPSATAVMHLGVRVVITAKIDQLFVTARDVTLESEGVIFQGKVLGTPPAGCGPLLPQRQLRAGQNVGGVVVFELPADFKADPRGPALAFQPTRWGGAKRTELRLPACLADCEKSERPRSTPRAARPKK
ncbi:MAG: hypothetical protein ABUR63_01690 [Verrucomicrobiota bacterium]